VPVLGIVANRAQTFHGYSTIKVASKPAPVKTPPAKREVPAPNDEESEVVQPSP
jgi:hypothetical protein